MICKILFWPLHNNYWSRSNNNKKRKYSVMQSCWLDLRKKSVCTNEIFNKNYMGIMFHLCEFWRQVMYLHQGREAWSLLILLKGSILPFYHDFLLLLHFISTTRGIMTVLLLFTTERVTKKYWKKVFSASCFLAFVRGHSNELPCHVIVDNWITGHCEVNQFVSFKKMSSDITLSPVSNKWIHCLSTCILIAWSS